MSEKAKAVFIGKGNHGPTLQALSFLRQFREVTAFLGTFGDPSPDWDQMPSDEPLFSFLGPWLIPERLLRVEGRIALNFHPASPNYPGVGCTNFALYDAVREYGVTCHHMSAAVDSGPIVAVRRFDVFANDTVLSLTQRAHAHLLVLWYDVVGSWAQYGELPRSSETWTRKAYTRRDLEELCVITAEMTAAEVKRRIDATTFPGKPGARIAVHGHTFHKNAEPAS